MLDPVLLRYVKKWCCLVNQIMFQTVFRRTIVIKEASLTQGMDAEFSFLLYSENNDLKALEGNEIVTLKITNCQQH